MNPRKQKNRETGDLGEKIAVNYLLKKGFTIIERNYWRKWGELDIIARSPAQERSSVSRETAENVHFIEVKTASYETKADLELAVARGTWRPEEQVHQFKLHQIHKALETWIADKQYDGEWQIDVMAVRVVPREKYATVKFIENIIS